MAAPEWVAVAATACCVVTAAGLVALEPSDRQYLVAALAVVLAASVGVRLVGRRVDLFEPLTVFVVAFGLMFVVRPAVISLDDVQVYEIAGASASIHRWLDEALSIALVGALAFTAGYFAPQPSVRSSQAPRPIERPRAWLIAMATAGLGAFLSVALVIAVGGLGVILSGRSGELTLLLRELPDYLWLGPVLLVPASLMFFVIWRVFRDRYALAMFLLSVAVLLVFRGPYGSRIVLLPLACGLFAFVYLRAARRPSLPTLVGAALLLLVLSATVLDVRNSETRQAGVFASLQRTLDQPSRLVEPIFYRQDASQAPALAAALSVVPEQVPHRIGAATVSDLVLRPIPRSLWPGKPLPRREQVISALWPKEYATGAANPEFSALLAFYLDLGVVGVALGLSAYGFGARRFWNWLQARGDDPAAQILYATSLGVMVIALRDGPVDTLVRTVFLLGPLLLLVRFGRVADPRYERSSAWNSAAQTRPPGSEPALGRASR